MKKITFYKSGTGITRCNHVIYNEEVSNKALSSLILLNDYYSVRDVDYLTEANQLQDYLNRRFIFLIKTKRKKGDLVCHYCHRPHLEAGYRHHSLSELNNKNPRLATIDHVVPVSANIDKLDESNWVVSCRTCNGRKGNMPYADFIKIIRSKKSNKKKNQTKKVLPKKVIALPQYV